MINRSKVNWNLKNTKKRFLERSDNVSYTNNAFEHAPLPQIWHISRLRNWISKPILCRSVTKDFVSCFVCDKTLVLFLTSHKNSEKRVSPFPQPKKLGVSAWKVWKDWRCSELSQFEVQTVQLFASLKPHSFSVTVNLFGVEKMLGKLCVVCWIAKKAAACHLC